MKSLHLLLAILSVTLSPEIGEAAPENCHPYVDDTARLRCYDIETGYSDLTQSSEVQTDTDRDETNSLDFGKWRITERTSEMTDFQNIFASLQSENDVRHEYSHQRNTGKASLLVRCMDNSTALTIGMDGQFLADIQGYGSVDIRIDDSSARSYRFSESTDNEVLGLWRGSAIPLLKRLIGAETVRFDVTPYNESSQVMRFDVRGIDNVITQVRERCSW